MLFRNNPRTLQKIQATESVYLSQAKDKSPTKWEKSAFFNAGSGNECVIVIDASVGNLLGYCLMSTQEACVWFLGTFVPNTYPEISMFAALRLGIFISHWPSASHPAFLWHTDYVSASLSTLETAVCSNSQTWQQMELSKHSHTHTHTRTPIAKTHGGQIAYSHHVVYLICWLCWLNPPTLRFH